MNESERQGSWREMLAVMPVRSKGGREAVEPAASSVVQGFLREALRLFEEKAAAFRSRGLEAIIEPASAEAVRPDSSIALFVSRPQMPGTSHTLRCQRNEDLVMLLAINREQLWHEDCSFALDREMESPMTFVEGFLERLESKTDGTK